MSLEKPNCLGRIISSKVSERLQDKAADEFMLGGALMFIGSVFKLTGDGYVQNEIGNVLIGAGAIMVVASIGIWAYLDSKTDIVSERSRDGLSNNLSRCR